MGFVGVQGLLSVESCWTEVGKGARLGRLVHKAVIF
jgi:hypothetical protein